MKLEEVRDPKYMLICGNAVDTLKEFKDNTFHMAVTSPPYWQQRDYNVEGQLGQESDPEEYISNLVAICEEVKRVLRKDGTFWLNIGDGYCSKAIKKLNLKPKDLVGIPWMFALAMRNQGWYLRSDIIWEKENPMPDSTKSRPSKSYEHLFLFSKSDKYFYDWYAIAESQREISIRRAKSKNNVKLRKDFEKDNYAISGKSQDKAYEKMRKKIEAGEDIKRNKRDVWLIATSSEKVDHFAAYSWKLINPCILAGSSSGGCCPKCKTPWNRIKETIEWEPACNCGEKEAEPCLVLDPFNGSGTTAKVCRQAHRKYVGIDINKEYIKETRDALEWNQAFDSNEVITAKEIVE